ncbi:monocarboxylate transporter 12-B-like [Plodia interpunctella]|uniref:monocarboxylate transporter 12-B-like n=1 Tax=Plodia interpunctella TaxID=58824 RepID=UPI002367E7E0|nr:monocarboxylate transporter 12-B-like [Plodia interpunctella]XP_053616012.1 monocarboxylate transporter 12-B-like [Plodia interpunctella]XP_053616016.1 monocarboxylate transporter 12-B-like [Plodia interpunctella]
MDSRKMSTEKSAMATEKYHKVTKLVPPDGGWGWMVLIGVALSNIFNQSMLSLFSLLYGDALEAMGHKTQGAAVVLSTMLFVTNFGGPIAGAVVKLTSPRTVALIGAVSCTTGIFLSGFSTNIVHLILTYGVLLGLGLGFIQNSSFVAINAYFKLKKSRAVGLANVGTGVGQTLMPHLVRYLLEHYGFQGACLILSGLSLHGIGGVLLIQPVEWHMKTVEEEVIVDEKLHLLEDEHKNIVIRRDSKMLAELNNGRRATEPTLNGNDKENPSAVDKKSMQWQSHKELNGEKLTLSKANGVDTKEKKPKSGLLHKIFVLFDISLLSSPRFLNILLGTALAVTSIQNFSMLFPLFLQKSVMLNKEQTAICMSAVAAADISGRLILPVFQDKFQIRARWMLIMTSVWLIVARQILAYQSELTILILMSCIYGFGRSMIVVARNIAISENCRMDQVPAAVGLGMLTMGIIVPPAGYFLGWIRDFTESYVICITAQNMLLVVLLVMWIPDMLILYMQDKRKKKALEEIQMS